MGGISLPASIKNRTRIIQFRKRCEKEFVARQNRAGMSGTSKVTTDAHQANSSGPANNMSELSDVPVMIQAKVVRRAQGVLVIEYNDGVKNYAGVLLAERDQDSSGLNSGDINRFRDSVKNFVDIPTTDQWSSMVTERQTTSGFQLRGRNLMRVGGRMVCASCLEAVPDNETIPRRHFIEANARKLLSAATRARQSRIFAEQMPDEAGYESAHDPTGNEKAECSSDASTSSESVPKKNKRKAYVPRGAYSVLVPAGVDLFEPEYDPLPSPASGMSKNCYNFRFVQKPPKKKAGLIYEAAKAKPRRGRPPARSSKKLIDAAAASGKDVIKQEVRREQEESVPSQNVLSDRSYTIRKSDSDALHLTLVCKPNSILSTDAPKKVLCGSATAHVREGAPLHVANAAAPFKAPNLTEFSPASRDIPLQSTGLPTVLRFKRPRMEGAPTLLLGNSSTCGDNAATSVQSSLPEKTDYSLLCSQMDGGVRIPALEHSAVPPSTDLPLQGKSGSYPCTDHQGSSGSAVRPPIKIVLKKSVNRTACAPPLMPEETSHSDDTEPARQRLPTNHSRKLRPVVNEQVAKTEVNIAKRRSDAGCPPMIKATPAEIMKEEVVSDSEGGTEKRSLRSRRVESEKTSTRSLESGIGKRSLRSLQKQKTVQQKRRRKKTIIEEPSDSHNQEEEFHPTAAENPASLEIGEVVWARNGTDAYWPGRIHGFNKQIGKCGASVVWLGVDTYSPFIEFSKIDRFVDSYQNRFNPKRTEQKYHKAVADAIIACLPERGYFEQKLSPQLYKLLLHEQKLELGDVKITSNKRRRRTTTRRGTSVKKRAVAVKVKVEVKTEVLEVEEPLAEARAFDGQSSAVYDNDGLQKEQADFDGLGVNGNETCNMPGWNREGAHLYTGDAPMPVYVVTASSRRTSVVSSTAIEDNYDSDEGRLVIAEDSDEL